MGSVIFAYPVIGSIDPHISLGRKMLINKGLSNDPVVSKGIIVVKDIELRLISELMKNSRRSDRELAKATGVSQPTVSRTIMRLEKEGVVKEYTMIPDFSKIGFTIMAVTFVNFSGQPSDEKVEELKSIAREFQRKSTFPTAMIMSGMGLGFDRIIVSFHEDYSSYSRFLTLSRQLSTQGIASVENFVINLCDKAHYQPLTMATLGRLLLERTRRE
jgi:DNA-binding Lrp family transcriptional regulator